MNRKNVKRIVLLALVTLIAVSYIAMTIVNGATPTKNAPKITRQATSDVAIVKSDKAKADDLSYDDIKKMVRSAVDMAGGFKGLIKDKMTVVLKPNLVTVNNYMPTRDEVPPEVSGITTDWRVTKAVVELVRELNPKGKVYVMEGSAGSGTSQAFKKLKYTTQNMPGVTEFIALESDSGKWRDTNSSGMVKVSLPNAKTLELADGEKLPKDKNGTLFYMNKKYQEADVLISIPCLKTHWSAAVTGGIKNLSIGASPANIYGNSQSDKTRNNRIIHDGDNADLNRWIRDYYLARPSDFVIMDGLQGLENGPTPMQSKSEKPKSHWTEDQMNMRLILAGKDAVAVDTIESLVMNWDPKSVKYLEWLGQDGAGNNDVSKIRVLGKQVDEVRKTFQGINPPEGGTKIKDFKAPAVSSVDVKVVNGKLNINVKANSDTKKVEVVIDGNRSFAPITKDFGKISLDISKLKKGSHKVDIWAFDSALNRTVKTKYVKN